MVTPVTSNMRVYSRSAIGADLLSTYIQTTAYIVKGKRQKIARERNTDLTSSEEVIVSPVYKSEFMPGTMVTLYTWTLCARTVCRRRTAETIANPLAFIITVITVYISLRSQYIK